MTTFFVPFWLACAAAELEILESEPPPPPPPPPAEEEASAVSPSLDPEVVALAAVGDWGALAEHPGAGPLGSWALVQLGRADEATAIADGPIPATERAWANGIIAVETGDPTSARELLAAIEEGHPLHRSAQVWLAKAEQASGDLEKARATYERLVAQGDPVDGNAVALKALADITGDPKYTRRLWTAYPYAPETAGISVTDPTWQEVAQRASAMQGSSDWDGILALMEPRVNEAFAVQHASSPDACTFHYVLGRAYYKKAKRPEAIKAFGTAARDCGGETGAKTAYLQGKTHLLRGQHRSAASVWERMAEDFPDHSYADDGLVLGGVALERAGDVAGAQRLWQKAADDIPDGDMVAEGLFHLAWTHYEAGDGATAMQVMAQVGAMSPERDRFHVPGAMYWAGRFALYPDVNDPNAAVEANRETAVTWWTQLVQTQPWSYYAVLAQGRLTELGVPAPVPDHTAATTWTLSRAVLDSDVGPLLEVGLVDAAKDHFDAMDPTTDERGWWTESRAAVGDDLAAHRELRGWLRSNMPASPTPDSAHLLGAAFPDLWLTEVNTATSGYRYESRYFHSIVRTESNFDPTAISWAGARGLCQVMPATGRGVGKWMGLEVTKADLLVPETNLKVGARYMEFLHEEFDDSPFLAAAGYNAGEHRVVKWDGEWGPMPTDEYVERIPFDETRGYVKRVVGTWQAYTWLRTGTVVDTSRYNHLALPGDPPAE
ncbi:MAG: transglycosylase SLT domain-containing protein [Proteobacteria bacterium]|nr:transglycosylase SLT domain-containing protein [Pseudomonadota bacterium]MCP4920003.1 transglycosylase SLT domain-containing protein [Pseudomonadota bacterium]